MTPDAPSLPLWASGGFVLRVSEPGRAPREVVVDRPFATLGRNPGADVVLEDPAVSGRHVFFLLDRRGVFTVDLATRTGSRVGPAAAPAAWLEEGDGLEVAGRTVTLLDWSVDECEDLGPAPPEPLEDSGDAPLARVTLFPEQPPLHPLSLASRLVFAGRSPSCGVRLSGASAMRVQCALVRGRDFGYVIDLIGRGTWSNEHPVRGAWQLRDGDSLKLGGERFQASIGPHDAPAVAGLPALLSDAPSPFVEAAPTELVPFEAPPLHLVPPEAQGAVLAWMMGQLQHRQDEADRRQGEFQVELVRLVAEIQRDNNALLARHLDRSEAIHREVSSLRDEIRDRFGDRAPAAPTPRPSLPKPPPLKLPTAPPADSPEAAADWLLARVGQLDQENRRGWKDLLGKISGRKDP